MGSGEIIWVVKKTLTNKRKDISERSLDSAYSSYEAAKNYITSNYPLAKELGNGCWWMEQLQDNTTIEYEIEEVTLF